jgi:hypothetical protein
MMKHESNGEAAISRRTMVAMGGGLAAMALTGATPARGRTRSPRSDQPSAGALPPGFPHQDPALVREVVGKSHFDLDAVRELVTARPALAKAAYDWGYGDWESALGAASHVGRPDIAEVLMAHGARPNVFTFAMLGNLAAVRAAIEAHPGAGAGAGVQRTFGPHGITLLSHARAGGDAAKEVLAYLEELGDADIGYTNLPLDDAQKQAIMGRYRFEVGGEPFEVVEMRGGGPGLKYGEDFPRGLLHQGDLAFHPAGADAVRFTFTVEDGAAVSFEYRDGDVALTAKREA